MPRASARRRSASCTARPSRFDATAGRSLPGAARRAAADRPAPTARARRAGRRAPDRPADLGRHRRQSRAAAGDAPTASASASVWSPAFADDAAWSDALDFERHLLPPRHRGRDPGHRCADPARPAASQTPRIRRTATASRRCASRRDRSRFDNFLVNLGFDQDRRLGLRPVLDPAGNRTGASSSCAGRTPGSTRYEAIGAAAQSQPQRPGHGGQRQRDSGMDLHRGPGLEPRRLERLVDACATSTRAERSLRRRRRLRRSAATRPTAATRWARPPTTTCRSAGRLDVAEGPAADRRRQQHLRKDPPVCLTLLAQRLRRLDLRPAGRPLLVRARGPEVLACRRQARPRTGRKAGDCRPSVRLQLLRVSGARRASAQRRCRGTSMLIDSARWSENAAGHGARVGELQAVADQDVVDRALRAPAGEGGHAAARAAAGGCAGRAAPFPAGPAAQLKSPISTACGWSRQQFGDEGQLRAPRLPRPATGARPRPSGRRRPRRSAPAARRGRRCGRAGHGR